MKQIHILLLTILFLSVSYSCKSTQRYIQLNVFDEGYEPFFHALDSALSYSNNAEKEIYQVFDVIFLDENGEDLCDYKDTGFYVLCFNDYCITSELNNNDIVYHQSRWYVLPKLAHNWLIFNPRKIKIEANDNLWIKRMRSAPMGFDNPLLYKWDPIHFTMEAIPLVPELGTLYYRICE